MCKISNEVGVNAYFRWDLMETVNNINMVNIDRLGVNKNSSPNPILEKTNNQIPLVTSDLVRSSFHLDLLDQHVDVDPTLKPRDGSHIQRKSKNKPP